MGNAFDVLIERGFVAQTTHEDRLRTLLGREPVTFYVGFDPTADSLHVGHFLQLVAMAHLQRHGHRPIAIVGGGTAMVGDPSGRTDLRQMLTRDQVAENARKIKAQIGRFLDFGEGKALLVDNAEWLLELDYVEFLRDIGVHFSVNRMLTAECFKSRLEKGLSFIEFNYMLMQAYDFYELHRRYNCRLQVGGDDQWSNILAGADLVRRKAGDEVYGLTLNLLTTSSGVKMGKTAAGAVWLDAEKTSPYDFYQYWRNTADDDVAQCLALLTFLPMDEVRRLSARKGQAINEAKEVLAFELTQLVHGKEEALKAQAAAQALFGGGEGGGKDVPTTKLAAADLQDAIPLLDLLVTTELVASKSEARRLVQQGGMYLNEERITDPEYQVRRADFAAGPITLRKGKKQYHQVVLG